MCNLYKMRRSAAEIAHVFGAEPAAGLNLAEDVYPGYPGMVVAGGRLRTMAWGFPLVLTGKDGRPRKPRPVNNARADKLARPFWRDSFRQRRCLIPVDAWAEAEGEPGRMTRTWYALDHGRPFAVAGLWRPTAEWGDAYAMVMVDGCARMAAVHDRMPVILTPADWQVWLQGTAEQALALCRTCDEPLQVDRTADPWATGRSRAGPVPAPPMPRLL